MFDVVAPAVVTVIAVVLVAAAPLTNAAPVKPLASTVLSAVSIDEGVSVNDLLPVIVTLVNEDAVGVVPEDAAAVAVAAVPAWLLPKVRLLPFPPVEDTVSVSICVAFKLAATAALLGSAYATASESAVVFVLRPSVSNGMDAPALTAS
jgi:hypothetical protein